MRKIKIGLFIDTFFPMIDGVIMVVDNYARKLSSYGDVTVFAPLIDKKFDDSTLPYKVVRCKSLKLHFIDYSLPSPDIDKEFLKELEKSNLDIVHIHSPFTIGKIGIKYAKKHNIPVVATMHSQFKQDFKRTLKVDKLAKLGTKIVIDVFNKCDECWAVNSGIAKLYYEDYKYKELPKVTTNATELLPAPDEDKSIERINKLHNLKDENVFLFVGRINKLKNVFFIADSLKYYKKMNDNFKMIFIGTGQDEETLKNHIKELGISRNVIFTGKITDRDLLRDYYVRADLFLFPSLYDANSIVQIEAASQKLPCLFLDKAKTASDIKDNVTGFLSIENPEEYANRINEIITNKKLYNKVSKNTFKELYVTWDDVAKRVYGEYLRLIEGRK
jgi:glycosyltransferase involved in cell wall biosynthesis